jgi:SAM-dependent methyltransferase
MTRHERLFYGIDLKHARGIEIGPLVTPIVSKEISEVYYVDHAGREELQAKYANDPNVNIEKIVQIDAVWDEKALAECFPDGRKFDYVLASHVMEHVPDMLGWLHEIAAVLRPGGRLLLAVPDKRFTFDYLRQPSRLSEVIDAYLRRIRRPTPAQIFDHAANAAEVDMSAAWRGPLDPESLKRYRDTRFALERSIESIRDCKYIDGHWWVFTGRSLAALFLELAGLDLLPYRCVNFYEPEPDTNEIDVILERLNGQSEDEKKEARASFAIYARRLEQAERETSTAARKQIAELETKVGVLESQINAIVSSKSFRITQPLRRLKALISSRTRNKA